MPCTASNVLAILIMYPIGAVLVVNALVIVGILFQEISQANYERDRKKGVDRLLGVKPSQFVEYQDDMRRAARGTVHASSRLSRLIDLNRRGLAVALLVVGFVGGLVHSYQMCFVA
jgi:hypothetical protein